MYIRNFKTYSDGCSTQGLSNHTTFRRFGAGETVPLKGRGNKKNFLKNYSSMSFSYILTLVDFDSEFEDLCSTLNVYFYRESVLPESYI